MENNIGNNKKNNVDPHTGIETTGHSWDGIQELNIPAPRWWLWVFYVCCIWAAGYSYFYPTWPTLAGNNIGAMEWTQHKQLAQDQTEIIKIQKEYLEEFRQLSFKEITHNDRIYAFSIAGGRAAFKDNCATCHGAGGSGAKGYPNLNDDDWLWGGSIEEIEKTIRHGIRSTHDETRFSQMTAFGRDGVLKRDQINNIVDHVASLSQKDASINPTGSALFQENCASCHGSAGKGRREFGAPNLTDPIWLYSGSREDIFYSVYNSRYGEMPTWEGRLDDDTIRQLSLYVHSLGGGE